MRVRNNAEITRPRGRQSPSNNLFPRRNHCFQLHLNFTALLQTILASFSCKSDRRYKKCQISIQEESLPFIFRLAYKKRVSKSAIRLHKESSQLLSYLFSLIFWCVSQPFAVSILAFDKDHELPKSTTVGVREDCFQSVQIHRYKASRLSCVINSIGILAIGLATILFLGESGIYTQLDTYLLAADHAQKQYKYINRRSLHVRVAILIALWTLRQVYDQRKIAKHFKRIFSTDTIFDMDATVSITHGVYQPVKDRLEEAEASTLQDVEIEARKKALVMNQNVEKPTMDAPNVSEKGKGNSSPIREHMSFSPSRMATRYRTETTENMSAISNSTSDVNLLADNSTRAIGSSSMYQQGSFSSPNLGSLRTDTQHAGHGLPRPGLFSRVTNTFLKRSQNGIDRSQIRSGMPIINEGVINFIETPTSLRLVRNLELEEQARLMGFELPQNRFGLPEESNDGYIESGVNQEKLSSNNGTMIPLEESNDASLYSDNASTLNEAENITGHHGLDQISPPDVANVATAESERGIDCQQSPSRNSMSWLMNCFTPSTIDNLLDDFGVSPNESKFPPRSSSLPKMAVDDQKNSCDFDEGSSEADDQPPMIASATEINRLRDVVRDLVQKFSAALSLKDAEIKDLNAREAAALSRVKFLESLLEVEKAGLEEPKEAAKSDRDSDLAAENHNKPGFMPNSRESFGGPGEERSSHRKSTSKEGGFFKGLIGTTEPSQVALKKLKERSLAEANADAGSPGLAAKLKVSARQLPPEAPKPASKEPVPRPKTYQRHVRSAGTLTGTYDPDLTLSLNPPSRPPPPRPDTTSGPEKLSLDNGLPEIKLDEAKQDEGKKDGKKKGLRNLFSRK